MVFPYVNGQAIKVQDVRPGTARLQFTRGNRFEVLISRVPFPALRGRGLGGGGCLHALDLAEGVNSRENSLIANFGTPPRKRGDGDALRRRTFAQTIPDFNCQTAKTPHRFRAIAKRGWAPNCLQSQCPCRKELRGEQEGPGGAQLHPQPRVAGVKSTRFSHYRFTGENPGLPWAQWVTAFITGYASPVNGLFLATVRLALLIADLHSVGVNRDTRILPAAMRYVARLRDATQVHSHPPNVL